NKGATARAVHKVSGSAGYVNAVRAAFLIAPDPGDESRKFFMPIKFNLGIKPASLAYRAQALSQVEAAAVAGSYGRGLDVEDRERLASQLFRVEWLGAVEADPDEVMASAARRERGPNKVERCKEWMKEFLGKFAYPSEEIKAAAGKAGFTFHDVRDAKAALKPEGLRNTNKGAFAGIWWSGFGDPQSWLRRPDTPDTMDTYATTGAENAHSVLCVHSVGTVGSGVGEGANDA